MSRNITGIKQRLRGRWKGPDMTVIPGLPAQGADFSDRLAVFANGLGTQNEMTSFYP